jgi:hypothetical protein
MHFETPHDDILGDMFMVSVKCRIHNFIHYIYQRLLIMNHANDVSAPEHAITS